MLFLGTMWLRRIEFENFGQIVIHENFSHGEAYGMISVTALSGREHEWFFGGAARGVVGTPLLSHLMAILGNVGSRLPLPSPYHLSEPRSAKQVHRRLQQRVPIEPKSWRGGATTPMGVFSPIKKRAQQVKQAAGQRL